MSVDIYSEIRAALDTYLITFADIPKLGAKYLINWENTQFDKPEPFSSAWLQTALLVAQPDGRTLGGTPWTRVQGVYHLNIFAPSGRGPQVADKLADGLQRHFKSGVRLTHGSTTLTLRTPSRAPGIAESDWYQVPVIVNWYHHTQEL